LSSKERLRFDENMEMLNRIHGSFLGIMIGDALGAPVEMMKPSVILEQTGGSGIVGFDHVVRRKPFRSEASEKKFLDWAKSIPDPGVTVLASSSYKERFLSKLPHGIDIRKLFPLSLLGRKEEVPAPAALVHGATTDDWQLTNAVCKSLIRRGRFDLVDQALGHVTAYEESVSGWGGTTRDGMKELQEYFLSKGERGRSPWDMPEVRVNRGGGNGVAMKVLPLALGNILRKQNYDKLIEEVGDLGRMTHSDPRAWAGAYALCCMMVELSTGNYQDKSGKMTEGDCSALLEEIIALQGTFERKYGSGGLKRFSSYLKVLRDSSLLFGPIEKLREEVGTGCIAIESVVFAIALFLRHPLDFRAAALEAVNSGGDTDTICSMVCGMIGFLVGVEGIPLEWKEYSSEFGQAEIVANDFYQAFK
jgi:ADP-ribosylglycohydrolase